jgi:hypothetical protein
VTVRLAPTGVAVVAVLVAFTTFVRPTAARVSALRERVQESEGRLAAAASEDSLLRAIGAQQHALALRLRQEERVDEGTAEAHVLADLTTAAATCNVSLISVSAKGTSSALTPAVASGDVTAGAASTSPAGELAAPRGVAGIRLPRSVVVEGALPGVLRFVDRLGHLREPVRLIGFSLSQHAQLQATIDIEVLVIDQQTLMEAQG